MSKPTSGLQTGKCPKCSGNEIYTDKLNQKAGQRCLLPLGGPLSFSRLFLDCYICSACGYLEDYINDADLNDAKKIDKVKETWGKVA
jgi:hypothetical protein